MPRRVRSSKVGSYKVISTTARSAMVRLVGLSKVVSTIVRYTMFGSSKILSKIIRSSKVGSCNV